MRRRSPGRPATLARRSPGRLATLRRLWTGRRRRPREMMSGPHILRTPRASRRGTLRRGHEDGFARRPLAALWGESGVVQADGLRQLMVGRRPHVRRPTLWARDDDNQSLHGSDSIPISVGIGADDLTLGPRAQGTIRDTADGALDPLHRAVAEEEVDDARMHAPKAEADPPVIAIIGGGGILIVLRDTHVADRAGSSACGPVGVGPGPPVARLKQGLADGEGIAQPIGDVANCHGRCPTGS